MEKITISVIKADVGGYVGHSAMHPDLIEAASLRLKDEQNLGKIIDFHVTACGDDLELIMTHRKGEENEKI
jgi:fructose 1,6-bisphosphate aldolase/phosphatase